MLTTSKLYLDHLDNSHLPAITWPTTPSSGVYLIYESSETIPLNVGLCSLKQNMKFRPQEM